MLGETGLARTGSHKPFDPAPYADFLENFDRLFFAYRNMHSEGEILLEMSKPTKPATDYITIESCEGTCFGVQALVKVRVAPEEELLIYRFEVVSAAELGLTWKYQNTLGKLQQTRSEEQASAADEGRMMSPRPLLF